MKVAYRKQQAVQLSLQLRESCDLGRLPGPEARNLPSFRRSPAMSSHLQTTATQLIGRKTEENNSLNFFLKSEGWALERS
jgi:hypothetical protein